MQTRLKRSPSGHGGSYGQSRGSQGGAAVPHLREPAFTWVCGICYGVWACSWWGQPCPVIPEPFLAAAQPLTSKHSLPVDCLSCPNPCNKFIFCSESTKSFSVIELKTLNRDWQYCCPSRALCCLSLCKVLTYSRKQPAFHCFYSCSFLPAKGTSHCTTLC